MNESISTLKSTALHFIILKTIIILVKTKRLLSRLSLSSFNDLKLFDRMSYDIE